MASALPRASESFRAPFYGGRHRTPPIHVGQLKMASALGPTGQRLSASFNGGQRKITFSAKAEHGGNSLDEGPQESKYPVARGFPDYERRVNVWWDAGRCPPPLNFDVSKIGSTIVEFLRRNFNTSRPIYLRVYGNLGELLPKMAKDTVRIISASGFKLAGFELKDDGGSGSNFVKYFGKKKNTLMTEDLILYGYGKGAPPVPIHMVILDRKGMIASGLDQLVELDRCCLICVEPEQESVGAVWRWKPLWPGRLSLMMGQCRSYDGGNSLDEGELFDDDANVKIFENDKIVSIWWDFGRCPLPSNLDAPKIASNITKALHRLNLLGGPIYLHAYGNIEEIGEDIVRFVCESGFQIVGFRLDGGNRPNISLVKDLEFDLDLRLYFSRSAAINIVISDGCGYPYVSLNRLRKEGNIIIPFEIILDEGFKGGDLLDDLLEEYGEHSDDENIFDCGHIESEYLVRHRPPNHNSSMNIWWDASRCPPPLDSDISQIGMTIIECSYLVNHPIYLHVYGNLAELLPKMVNNTIRIFTQLGLKLEGFEVKDKSNVSDFILAGFQRKRKYFFNALEENLLMDDLIYHNIIHHPPPRPLHMVVLDGKVTTSTLNQLHMRGEWLISCLVREQEFVNGVWRWKILWNGE